MESNLRVEYLIVVEKKGSICNSIETFNNLVKSNNDLDIKDENIIYKKSVEAGYQVVTDEIEDKKQRYFHITLTF